MANREHFEKLRQGVEAWNQWRADYPDLKPDLSGANLSRANLSGANLYGANLNGVKLSDAKLNGAVIGEATLRRANLSGADLSWGDLRVVDLSGSYLGRATLEGAYLLGAILRETNLSVADLNQARLIGADLSEADLSEATFIGADLTEATFIRADLNRVDFNNANLSGADFGEAKVMWTTFGNNDLSSVKGLDTVEHIAPSTIGIDTIYRSQGKIPESFLIGCGLPQQFIDYIPSLIGAVEPFQYHSCFISYSTKDGEFAKRLHSRLRDAKIRVWFAPEDIKGGVKLYDQIERAIQLHDRLLVVLSENSLRSEWVMTEIRKAREAEKRENRRKLFPIRLVDFEQIRQWRCFDADSGKDLAVEVREYFIPDFSNWKDHDSFEKAFERLLRDLREAEDAKEEA
jgi:uncharacterized protein YjbI with pentapeptide repeats